MDVVGGGIVSVGVGMGVAVAGAVVSVLVQLAVGTLECASKKVTSDLRRCAFTPKSPMPRRDSLCNGKTSCKHAERIFIYFSIQYGCENALVPVQG